MVWPFSDPPNVAVFTSKSIIQGNEWIYYVSHDLEDGAWQFHPQSGFTSEEEASVVSLQSISDLDPSICELADLPLGWCAWRDTIESDWKRKKIDD
jgi:hypothetical protein